MFLKKLVIFILMGKVRNKEGDFSNIGFFYILYTN